MSHLTLATPRPDDQRETLIAALHAELDIDLAITEARCGADLDHAYERLDAAIARLDQIPDPQGRTGKELAAWIGQAEDGAIPLWFQRGRFLVESDGLRAIADTGTSPIHGAGVMTLHAVDFDQPFIASVPDVTRLYWGHENATPYDVARSWLRTAVRSGTSVAMAPNLVTLPPLIRWPWLAKVQPGPAPVDRAQYAFAL